MGASNLGIRRLQSIEMCLNDAGPWLEYLTERFGFQPLAASTGAAIEETGTCRRLLRCGGVCLVLQEAVHTGSFVKHYLDRHPEGISRVNFLVSDVRAAEQWLVERHATPTDFIETLRAGSAEWNQLCITTPLGDVEYCFVETGDETGMLMPGMEPTGDFDPAHNPLGLTGIDHLTADTRTLMPVIAFHEHVLGFARCWDVRFHAEDFRPGIGGGLTSVVMRDEASGIKLALNEPLRPRFDQSQVQHHVEMNHGPGIRHIALEVRDMMRAVDHCQATGILLMPTPRAYYRALPERIRSQGIGRLDLALEEIEKRDILVDGDPDGYLLQVFCKDQVAQFNRPNVGPVSIEMIQRSGCRGFGEANFRALFEASEQE